MGLADNILESIVPEPFEDASEFKQANRFISGEDDYTSLPMKQVRTDMLIPTQAGIDQDKVDDIADKGDFDGILVVMKDGKPHLLDGHHRHEAAKQMDRPTIWAHIWEP